MKVNLWSFGDWIWYHVGAFFFMLILITIGIWLLKLAMKVWCKKCAKEKYKM